MFRYFFNPLTDDLLKSELSFVLGEPLHSLGRSQGGVEKELSRRMIKYWADFAKHDDPNGEDDEQETACPQFEGPSWEYLKIEGEERSIGEDMRGRVCLFWDKIVPQFLPPVQDLLSHRSDTISDQTCRQVRQTARMYFPGYRAVVRL